MHAINSNNIEEIQNLLKEGFSINTSQIRLASKVSTPEIFKILIDHYTQEKSHQDIRDDQFLQLLFVDAIKKNDINNLKILLNAGVHPNDIGHIQDALMLAAEYGNADMVKELLDRNVDVHYKNENSETPFHKAAELGKADVLHLFLNHPATKNRFDINEKTGDFGENTALHLAAYSGNQDAVKILLKHNANTEDANADGETPLHIASSKNIACSKALIDAGANINAKSFYDITPLHSAAQSGKTDIVELLLKHNASIDAQNKYGETPLHLATKNHDATTVDSLIQHGADINLKNNDHYTAGDFAYLSHEDYPAIHDAFINELKRNEEATQKNKSFIEEKEMY